MGYKGKKPTCPTCGHVIHTSHAKALKEEPEGPSHVEVAGSVKKATEKAILYACASIGGIAMEVWIPKSHIDGPFKITGEPITIKVKRWFAEKERMRHE